MSFFSLSSLSLSLYRCKVHRLCSEALIEAALDHVVVDVVVGGTGQLGILLVFLVAPKDGHLAHLVAHTHHVGARRAHLLLLLACTRLADEG